APGARRGDAHARPQRQGREQGQEYVRGREVRLAHVRIAEGQEQGRHDPHAGAGRQAPEAIRRENAQHASGGPGHGSGEMRGRTAVRVHERLKARGTEAAEPGPDSLPHAVHRREQVHVERRVREEMRIGLAAEDRQAARYRELLVRAILAGQAETDAGKTEPGRDGEKNEERGPARPRRGGLSSAPRCVQGRDTPALRVLVFVNKSVTTTAPSMIWFPIRTFEAPPASVAAERALPI